MSAMPLPQDLSTSLDPAPIRLGQAGLGFVGTIVAIDASNLAQSGPASQLPAEELEQRLLEMGFVEGARVEIRHQGPLGRDPIAVRVNQAMVALRRAEACAIYAQPQPVGAR